MRDGSRVHFLRDGFRVSGAECGPRKKFINHRNDSNLSANKDDSREIKQKRRKFGGNPAEPLNNADTSR